MVYMLLVSCKCQLYCTVLEQLFQDLFKHLEGKLETIFSNKEILIKELVIPKFKLYFN